jgi:teichuronic acid biosynthesis glycosyltransferase TuaC
MRVLMLSSAYPSARHPAAGAYVERSERALRAAGAEVVTVALRTRVRGRLATPAKYAALALRASAAATRRPDVIWGHFLVPTGEVARRVARLRRVPYVVTAHGSDVANAEASERLAGLTRRVVAEAAAVVAVSPDLAGRLERIAGPIGERLHVISAGVDVGTFHPGDREVAAAALGWDPPATRLVHLGNLVEVKNLPRLLEAFAALREDGPAALALVGGGPLEAELRARAAALRIDADVRFAGELDSAAAARYLRAAHAACLVSLREGLGLAALEALACGRPVALSRAAGAASVLRDGVTGALCDPQDVSSIAAALRVAVRLDPGPAAVAAAAPYELGAETARLLAVLERAAAAS